MPLLFKSDLIKYNLLPKELDITLSHLNSGNINDVFLIRRVFDRIDSNVSFYDALKAQYKFENKMDIQAQIYRKECDYCNQMNSIYQHS
jgi:hypothetical protein